MITEVSDELLDGFLEAYPKSLGLRCAHVGIAQGTVNTSYRLELDSGVWFLRLYEQQDLAGATNEALLLQRLAHNGVPTPAPIAAIDGAYVRMLAGKPAALFPWVEGAALRLVDVTPREAEALGRAMANIHLCKLTAASSTPEPAHEHKPELKVSAVSLGAGRFTPHDLFVQCARISHSGDDEARGCRATLEKELLRATGMRRSDVPMGLVHGDLFRDNVLWKDGRIAALLDFESACEGPYVYDLAVALLAWSYRATFDFAVARSMVAGYTMVRPLHVHERDALYAEMVFACVRFAITRITDDAARVGKRWQRFVDRLRALEALGPKGLAQELAL